MTWQVAGDKHQTTYKSKDIIKAGAISGDNEG